jgi:hypothetical protein
LFIPHNKLPYYDSNGQGLQKSSKSKKSRPAPNAVGQAGPSSASDDNAGRNMVVKAEEVNLVDAEDDSKSINVAYFLRKTISPKYF